MFLTKQLFNSVPGFVADQHNICLTLIYSDVGKQDRLKCGGNYSALPPPVPTSCQEGHRNSLHLFVALLGWFFKSTRKKNSHDPWTPSLPGRGLLLSHWLSVTQQLLKCFPPYARSCAGPETAAAQPWAHFPLLCRLQMLSMCIFLKITFLFESSSLHVAHWWLKKEC